MLQLANQTCSGVALDVSLSAGWFEGKSSTTRERIVTIPCNEEFYNPICDTENIYDVSQLNTYYVLFAISKQKPVILLEISFFLLAAAAYNHELFPGFGCKSSMSNVAEKADRRHEIDQKS